MLFIWERLAPTRQGQQIQQLGTREPDQVSPPTSPTPVNSQLCPVPMTRLRGGFASSEEFSNILKANMWEMDIV